MILSIDEIFFETDALVPYFRGSPMSVSALEEILDDNNAIVTTSVDSEH
jgi:hypothetical protein